jgi:hypothetical protein
MGSRRALLGVAHGTASAFSNRGNDVDGWWALGLLLAETEPADPDYRLDLLTGKTLPESLTPALDELGPAWARYFQWTLARHGVPSDRVATALLTVRFHRDEAVYQMYPGIWNRPFECTVTILDDRGHRYERTFNGACTRLAEFGNPNHWLRPLRSGPPFDPGRVNARISRLTTGLSAPGHAGDIDER